MSTGQNRYSPSQLNKLLTNLPPGATLELTKLPTGEVVVSADDPKQTKQELLDQKFNHLKGQGITLTDASKKYQVPRSAIRDWVYKANYINFVDEDCYPKVINEAEVALCAWIYKDRKQSGLSGIPFFDEEGVLIRKRKHPDLAEKRRRERLQEENQKLHA